MTRLLEHDYKRALMGRAAIEFPAHRFFSRTVAMVRSGDRSFRAGTPGQCDVYILGKGGGHWELELKRFAKLSPAQFQWSGWCQEWGIPWKCLHVWEKESPAQTLERWVSELRPWLTPRP